MLCLRKFLFSIVFIIGTSQDTSGQTIEEVDEYTYDTTSINAFEGAGNLSFKLDYYHTEGISTSDRFWYEIMVLDSLVILNFKSPESDSWNFISYQKRMIINDSALAALRRSVKMLGIGQKRKGIPEWLGSGYGADRLFIESKDTHVAAGTVFMCIGNDKDVLTYNRRIRSEKQQSSSISGNYEKFFKELEYYFMSLPILKEDCSK